MPFTDYHDDVKHMRYMTICVALLLLLLDGCKRGNEDIGKRSDEQTFPIRGRIVSVDPATNQITLAHEAVPGFMGAMTMPYRLGVPGAIGELHPGDVITARIVVEKDSDGEYHNANLDRIVTVGQAKADYVPVKQYHVPKVGDAVPNFRLLDQSGKTLTLSQFKGKAVLLTFIYTRCPLGDFCPKMSRNFAEVNTALAADKSLYARTDLISISFDPVYDKPGVLKSYGAAYTGRYTQETFDHWQFAAPSQDELPKVEQYFNVGVTGADASLTHSLSTVLIDPAGTIAAWYPGNDWKPADVIADMRRVATKS